MAFVTGLMGPYMSPIPINASMGMFVVTPWLALKLLGGKHGAHAAHAPDKVTAKLDPLFRKYVTPFLDERTGRAARRKLWLGILAAIVVSVSLALVQLVVLKMLPFDNKSEFQVVLDMPAGTPLEAPRACCARSGRDRQGAGSRRLPGLRRAASPINFNGLVRQYYLRASPELGDIQVNLVDKHHRSRQSHEIAVSVRDAIVEAIGEEARRQRQGRRSAAGPAGALADRRRDLRPRLRRPDRRGEGSAQGLRGTPDIVGVDDSVTGRRAEVRAARLAEQGGAARRRAEDIVEVVRMGLAGEDVTPVHNATPSTRSRCASRCRRRSRFARRAAQAARAFAQRGNLVPVSELVEVREQAAREGHLPQGPAAGGVRRRRHGRQARLAALRHVRHPRPKSNRMALDGSKGRRHARRVWFIRQPKPTPTPATA
jgi:multidrug efflux pump subunit AcrB